MPHIRTYPLAGCSFLRGERMDLFENMAIRKCHGLVTRGILNEGWHGLKFLDADIPEPHFPTVILKVDKAF